MAQAAAWERKHKGDATGTRGAAGSVPWGPKEDVDCGEGVKGSRRVVLHRFPLKHVAVLLCGNRKCAKWLQTGHWGPFPGRLRGGATCSVPQAPCSGGSRFWSGPAESASKVFMISKQRALRLPFAEAPTSRGWRWLLLVTSPGDRAAAQTGAALGAGQVRSALQGKRVGVPHPLAPVRALLFAGRH